LLEKDTLKRWAEAMQVEISHAHLNITIGLAGRNKPICVADWYRNMLFSHDSAMRELRRLNESGGEGLYAIEKRWYGWVIVDTDWSDFNPFKDSEINKLCRNAQALLDMDAQGILRPIGVCGAARQIIEKFIEYNRPRLRQDVGQDLKSDEKEKV
jgi:hypothetical protein